MKKSLIVLAALASVASVASAQSSVTMYGRVDLSVGKNSGESAKYLQNGSGSRLGMRGVEDLGGGMSAFFNIEHRFNADTGAATDPARMWGGRSLVGLQGGFGKITLGREYTTSFLGSQLVADPWGWDTVVASSAGAKITIDGVNLVAGKPAAIAYGGTAGITGLAIAKVRNDSSVTYNFAASGFSFAAQVAEATDAINNTAKKPYNFALGYAAGPVAVGFGYEVTGVTATAAMGGKKEKLMTVNGAYDLGMVKLGAFYGKGDSATTGSQHKSYMLTAVAPMGQGEFRAAFGQLKADSEKVNRMFAFGYHYALSKRTTIYADLVNNSNAALADAASAGGTYGTPPVRYAAPTSKTGYDFGIKHNF